MILFCLNIQTINFTSTLYVENVDTLFLSTDYLYSDRAAHKLI